MSLVKSLACFVSMQTDDNSHTMCASSRKLNVNLNNSPSGVLAMSYQRGRERGEEGEKKQKNVRRDRNENDTSVEKKSRRISPTPRS